jgi:hypothetical protein
VTYLAISSCVAFHWAFCASNKAAICCSSVMPACMGVGTAGVAVEDLFDACSFRDEFFIFVGIFPDMYLAALPAPGLLGGSRRAMTDVERGISVVSSSYSVALLAAIYVPMETFDAYHLCHCRHILRGRNLFRHLGHS